MTSKPTANVPLARALAPLPYTERARWALEGLSQSLAQEVAGIGIKVTLMEPGGYPTDWGGWPAPRCPPDFDASAATCRAWPAPS